METGEDNNEDDDDWKGLNRTMQYGNRKMKISGEVSSVV